MSAHPMRLHRAAVALGCLLLTVTACGGTPSPSPTTPTAPSPTSGSPTATGGGQVLPSTPTGETTVERPAQQVPAPAGIPGLLAWNTAGYPGPGSPGPGSLTHEHVPGPVVYAVTPPVGGPHSPVWMNAGVYTEPVPSERAVHDLEHGAVWITYDRSLRPEAVATLTSLVSRQSLIPEETEGSPPGQANRYVILSPWGGGIALPSPIVISSWGYQLRVSDPADPRLQAFIDTFRSSATYSPEAGSPVDGIPVLTGGRAASDGGAVPNPEGSLAP